MLEPALVAAWIAFCIPWADPLIAAALVQAGSGGESYLVTDAAGQPFAGKTLVEADAYARKQAANGGELFLGLAQVPLSTLRQEGYRTDDGLDRCGSLDIGYQAFQAAYQTALSREKTPARALPPAFAYYRAHSFTADSEFARKAAEYVLKGRTPAPAPLTLGQRQDMFREWAAGLAQRMGHRTEAMNSGAQPPSPANPPAAK